MYLLRTFDDKNSIQYSHIYRSKLSMAKVEGERRKRGFGGSVHDPPGIIGADNMGA
jgi:hypothetical protein